MDKFAELKNEYDALLSFVHEQLPTAETEDSLSAYFTAAALKIWGSNILYSPDYATLLCAVSGENYTIEQVVTAMSCCGDPERQLLIPSFFQRFVEKDAQHGSSCAAEAIDRLNSLLVAAAMINGDFTLAEASCLSSIITGLTRYARAAGVNVPKAPDYRLIITPKKEASYLQNEALLSAPQPEKTQSADGKAENSAGDDVAPITIRIELTAEDAPGVNVTDQTPAPEEAGCVTALSAEGSETVESLLAELDGLVGLDSVKQDIHSLMNFIKVSKIREDRGLKVPTISYHLVFTGNPGTGKTTVARLVAKLYYHMGILPQGQLIEADRSALVAGYLGQTAIKTQKIIQQAMGGVLFIDEAYSLAGETDDSYGKEAIDTILKAMEDHRDELVVIVAGYTGLMRKFIGSNPGLSSRFSKYFEYPDYSGSELMTIFERFCAQNGYRLDSAAAELLKREFDALYAARDEHFGNARTARNIFEKAINAQADRIASQDSISDADLENITAADVAAVIGGAV